MNRDREGEGEGEGMRARERQTERDRQTESLGHVSLHQHIRGPEVHMTGVPQPRSPWQPRVTVGTLRCLHNGSDSSLSAK